MLKLGIIGAGRIGKVHGESITKYVPNATVVAIADPFANEQTEAWAVSLGIPSVSKNYKDILNNKEIDAVLVCSSTDTHADISIEAARAGKHVFCEKPVDHDLDKIKKVLEVMKETGVKFQVGFNRRFDHNFAAVREAVKAGKVGDVHLVKITSRDPAPPSPAYVKVSGGMFLDMTIHDFDMVRFLSGAEVVEVYASGDSLVDKAIGEAGDVDTAVIVMKLDNGAIAVIDNSRKAAYGYDQRAEVFGSKGAVQVTNDTNSTAVISTEDGVFAEKPLYFFLERYMQSFSEEMRQFATAVENDTPTPVTGIDGLKPVLIGMAAKKSMAEHRAVLLSEME